MDAIEAVNEAYDARERERNSFEARMAKEATGIAGESPADYYLYSWPSIRDTHAKLVFSAAFSGELPALRYYYAMRHMANIHLRKPGKDGKYWMVSNWSE